MTACSVYKKCGVRLASLSHSSHCLTADMARRWMCKMNQGTASKSFYFRNMLTYEHVGVGVATGVVTCAVTYWLVKSNTQQLQHGQEQAKPPSQKRVSSLSSEGGEKSEPLPPGSPAVRRLRNSSNGTRSRSSSASSPAASPRKAASAVSVASPVAPSPTSKVSAKKLENLKQRQEGSGSGPKECVSGPMLASRSRFTPSVAERAGVVCTNSHKDMLSLIEKCTELGDAVLIVSGTVAPATQHVQHGQHARTQLAFPLRKRFGRPSR